MKIPHDNDLPTLFYGVPSGCSFGSIVALEWLGRPYQLCRIEMPDVVSSDAYKRINAVGETPTMRTAAGDFISESLAILNHIGALDLDRALTFTQGTPAFDRLNQVLAYLNTSFFDAYAPFWYALEHDLEATEKKALTHYGQAKVLKAHADLEAMLGDQPWLLGGHRTLADAYFIGIARWNEYHQVVDRRDYPNLQRLYGQLEADPAVVFAHAIEQRESANSAGGFMGEISLDEVLEKRGTPPIP
ncbi:glutathione S-transferase family protein [Flavobacterium sp. MXW15]|uniref:Glutathione S-transferase family protein n=1 Tax=Xanthomonas chitinilytica TaxID=2989819 RepID=A0ABT3K0P2_9XANT|nr:glutathione S-transferase family protein [Xanthomonas sp. H13-6]MCW4456598.1 glutathione S-transferase family protein [Flavobacterium sp. MXW15]MCW4474300.1 glutathione S-transferase family protein [Xanthomonas sp. H13-6]